MQDKKQSKTVLFKRVSGLFSSGFTLIEILFVLLIFTILFYLGAPKIHFYLQHFHANQAIRNLQRSMELARLSAISKGVSVMVCPVDGIHNYPRPTHRLSCTRDWSKGWSVFIDRNNNRAFDANETILQHASALESRAYLKVAGFGSSQRYIYFVAQGNSYTNSTITYCAKKSVKSLKRVLIINRVGRTRISVDFDGDGEVDEGSNC